ncbi:hypothetical protein HNO52_18205 [Billgrantia diversa]|uniref:hypothetical protein n=1 Tax=Halomonas sp. MCCC 1A13316 TaxID=2733487 RepID=UPI0018A5C9AF|nr:hypothetical protein [Halomonas sp. MCCC 1A13316]QOR40236.1 hypothetical protein HNO52_18205 [Halomonas sp. MCCC 1A13316]
MQERDDIYCFLNQCIEKYGLTKTKEIVGSFFKEMNEMHHSCQCYECDEKLTEPAAGEKFHACQMCNKKYCVFQGRCRTTRKSGISNFKKLSIRYYNSEGNEKLFEVVQNDLFVSNVDIKSKDVFEIQFDISTSSARTSHYVRITNLTTGRIYNLEKARIFDLHEQLPNVFRR